MAIDTWPDLTSSLVVSAAERDGLSLLEFCGDLPQSYHRNPFIHHLIVFLFLYKNIQNYALKETIVWNDEI